MAAEPRSRVLLTSLLPAQNCLRHDLDLALRQFRNGDVIGLYNHSLGQPGSHYTKKAHSQHGPWTIHLGGWIEDRQYLMITI